ncbi:MAG TPA: 1,4-dihydroxy-2-naphthoate polyprenyltransferase [Thermoanaerobaculia bacterium]|nr:1,4-dihydroxy-2-naphthoate polyprenyltransferase [Thermoanaerobaculia bacterium]
MIRAWLLASRPKTLAAAVSPVMIGTALVLRDELPVDWRLAACALLGAIFIQIGTNFVNDALDFRKGADTSERLGPLRVTQAGLLSARSVLRGASICFVIAALFGIPLVLRGGWPLLVIGVASIVAAYAYTGGPWPLAYYGLGELFVLVFFGLVAVGGTYYVLTLSYTAAAALCGIAAGSLAIVLLAINNLRDIENDRRAGKRTVAVRIGEGAARVEVAAAALLPYAAVLAIGDPSLLLVTLSLPLAVFLIARVGRSRGAALNRSLALAGALQWAFSLLFLAGAMI